MKFRGRSQRNLDPKGRLMLSPEFRACLLARMDDDTAKNQDIFTQPTHITTNKNDDLDNSLTQNPKNDTEGSPEGDFDTSLNHQPNESPKKTKGAKKEDVPETTEIKFMLTTYDGCLVAYPMSEWYVLEHQFSKLTNPSTSVRNFRRLFIGNAEEHIIDSQGRIRLSQPHREYANIEKEVTILGLTTRFELWNPETYQKIIEAQTLDDVSDELSASGINFSL